MDISQPPPGAGELPVGQQQQQLFETPDARPPWPAGAGFLGLLFGLIATVVLITFIGAFYFAAGYDDPNDAASFDFVGIAAQSAALIGTALIITSRYGRPRAQQFGFRKPEGSAFGWALTTLVGYFVLAALYSWLASPPQDDLTQKLGADKSTVLAIVTGVFVIAVAPPVEEFFFRGFLYQAFRNRIGIAGGSILSGVIFGAIHTKPDYFVPLATLGTLLALLFEKTDSIWPCILVHAVNNALAFSVSV
jgi:CAAX protease family protein